MGDPIEHSRSPWTHAQFAKEYNLAITYTRIRPEKGCFSEAVSRFRLEGGHGLNVTAPFKQEAWGMATALSPRAAIAKSVNTIQFLPDGGLYGDNTDGIGLVNDITKNLDYDLHQKTVLIMGAGGAVRGILYPILLLRPATVIIANRTLQNAQKLCDEFGQYGMMQACGFQDLAKTEVDVIIDGTGFNADLPLPATLRLSTHSLCYDMKYGHPEAPLMKWARSHHSHLIADGVGMHVEQAAESFFLWTGKRPSARSVIHHLAP